MENEYIESDNDFNRRPKEHHPVVTNVAKSQRLICSLGSDVVHAREQDGLFDTVSLSSLQRRGYDGPTVSAPS